MPDNLGTVLLDYINANPDLKANKESFYNMFKDADEDAFNRGVKLFAGILWNDLKEWEKPKTN
ncbi:MAG TPA: hypothetical protein VF691_22050 [Cytophagaceae bacterium]|jgi:hypothetical protein